MAFMQEKIEKNQKNLRKSIDKTNLMCYIKLAEAQERRFYNMLNDRLLRAKIVEKGKTFSEVASILGIDVSTFSKKINNLTEFKRSEMQIIRMFLELSVEESEAIFFAEELA